MEHLIIQSRAFDTCEHSDSKHSKNLGTPNRYSVAICCLSSFSTLMSLFLDVL